MVTQLISFLTLAALFVVGPSWGQSGLLVVTSDFQTGSVAHLSSGSSAATVDLLTIHSDAVPRYHDGRVYVINRLGQDNILVLDATDLRSPVIQFSVGNGSNPQDIAFAGVGKAYVSRYASASLLILDPRDGSELSEIDLSVFADADGIPEMGQMAIVGDHLYITCQRLDRNGSFEPVAPSLLVVVDMTSDRLVDMDRDREGIQGWELSATNPNQIVAAGTELYVGLTGSFGDTNGGIEILDTVNRLSRGLVVDESQLGGDLTWIELVSNVKAYAVISDADFLNHVKPVDLRRRTVGPSLVGHSKAFTPSLALHGHQLVVPDRGNFDAPETVGLLVYDTLTDALIDGPIPVGLPPLHIASLEERQVTAVLEQTSDVVPEQLQLDEPFPNPFNSAVNIRFTLSEPARHARLVVYDTLGQEVRILARSALDTGYYETSWDGRDDQGRPVASGAYFVILSVGERQIQRKILFAK